jgi:hypothetical protein
MQTRLYAYLDLLASSGTRAELSDAMTASGKPSDPIRGHMRRTMRRLASGVDAELSSQNCDKVLKRSQSRPAIFRFRLCTAWPLILQRHPLQSGIPVTALCRGKRG